MKSKKTEKSRKIDAVKEIKVNNLARVEGEGSLYIKLKENIPVEVRLNIFEPPRFFEAFLRGRMFTEAIDMTARICGICPVAYQMSAAHAMEDALEIKIGEEIRKLRRLLYCGEWIESHVLHIYLLHAPDFLGYESSIQLAEDYPEIVKRGLRLKKLGNSILELVGGRAVHPLNVRVGGFYRIPLKNELRLLKEELKWGIEACYETVSWTSEFSFPEFERDYEFVSLSHPEEYPFNEGKLISNKGLDIPVHEYDRHFVEEQVKHSHALHSKIRDRDSYLVGPLARFNLNFEKLFPEVKEAARSAKLLPVCGNPFKSILVRSLEVLQACLEALRIIEQYEEPEHPAVPVSPTKEEIGYGCTEAPRGILYHRYSLDEKGIILDAKIVPPTSQNQKTIEEDLESFVKKNYSLPQEKLTWQCEQVIRNYDPCISCSTH